MVSEKKEVKGSLETWGAKEKCAGDRNIKEKGNPNWPEGKL